MIDRVADCFDGQRVRLLPMVVTDAAPGGGVRNSGFLVVRLGVGPLCVWVPDWVLGSS